MVKRVESRDFDRYKLQEELGKVEGWRVGIWKGETKRRKVVK